MESSQAGDGQADNERFFAGPLDASERIERRKRDLLRTKPREASPPEAEAPPPATDRARGLAEEALSAGEARWVLLRRDLAALQAQVSMLTERAAAGYDAEQREHERGRSRPETLAAAARTTTSPRHGSDLKELYDDL